jgi:peptidoglycan/xylan/chitin deacetylase (PgdA/CDA1 family)
LFAGFFYYGGLFHLLRFVNNNTGRRLTVLAYHRVADHDLSKIKASLPYLFVTKDSFAKQLDFITSHYHVINFKELKGHLAKHDLPHNSLIITFDDGYEDNYRNAFPLMRKLNIPAVMFITSNKIGHGDCRPYWWDRMYSYLRAYKDWYVEGLYPELDREILPLLTKFKTNTSDLFGFLNQQDTNGIDSLLDSIQTCYKIAVSSPNSDNTILRWEQVREMGKDVEFGSHTCNHYNLVTLDPNKLVYEIAESLKIIKTNTEDDVLAFSYPGGNYNEKIADTVARSGYDFAVTTDIGINDLQDTYALRRISVWEGTSRGNNGKFSTSLFAYKLLGL